MTQGQLSNPKGIHFFILLQCFLRLHMPLPQLCCKVQRCTSMRCSCMCEHYDAVEERYATACHTDHRSEQDKYDP